MSQLKLAAAAILFGDEDESETEAEELGWD
jgi:hypothetical protein